MKPVIRLHNISKKFGDLTVVNDVSLDIFDGEFLTILGPSGCGKTTLLRMLGGFEYPDSGRIIMGEDDITYLPPNRRPLNMVFQTYAVFPHLSVWDNVAYGLKLQKLDTAEINRRVKEALALVQMSDFARRAPDKLSGGQRQRVALARAIIMRPKVLLLDEPLSALDAKLRESMQSELVNLQRTVGITFVIVTHDQSEALSMASRVAVMQQGVFRQIDPPQVLYDRPNCRFVADFIGRMNIFPCDSVRAAAAGGGAVIITLADGKQYTIPAPSAPLQKPCLGIRPENLTFSETAPPPDHISFAVTVIQSAYYGSDVIIRCHSDHHPDSILCKTTAPIAKNTRGHLHTPPSQTTLFTD